MNSPDPDWWDLQAAEFVLRTLDDSERLVFEKILAKDPELQKRVRVWERRLDPLHDSTPPVQPSAAVWLDIMSALKAASRETSPVTSPVVIDASEVELWRRRARNWKITAFTGFATAAAVAGLLMLNPGALRQDDGGVPVVPGSDDRQADAGEGTGGLQPSGSVSTVSILQSEEQVPVWAITYQAVPAGEQQPSDDLVAALTERLVITVVGPPVESREQSYQLWVAHDDESVHSVGLLPGGVGESVTLEMPIGLNVADHFAVSLEPLGGSPEAGPTGPVLSSGTVVKPVSGI